MSLKRNSLIALVAAALLSLSLNSGFADSGAGNKGDENGGRGKIEFPLDGATPKGIPGFLSSAASRNAGAAGLATLANQYGIQYHGGAVMNDPAGVNVNIIWYGNWGSDTALTILPDFLKNLSGSAHFGINNTYTDANGVPVTSKINVVGQYTYPSTTLGTTLTDANILKLAKDALGQGTIPAALDSNALYFVLTAVGIKESSGFLTAYCGWHSSELMDYLGAGSVGAAPVTNMKYSFVGNAGTVSGCGAQNFTAGSPNNNVGADGMASVIAHELEETITDPDGNAWWTTANGQENADKCAWKFGTTSQSSTTATYTAPVSAVSSNGNATATVTSATNNSANLTASVGTVTNNSTTTAAGTTVTLSATNSFLVGDRVTVPTLPTPYNTLVITNQQITARTSSTFTVALATPKGTTKNVTVNPKVTATVSRVGTTITYNAANSFAVGQSVSVTAPSPYGVTSQAITARTTTSFTVAVALPAGTASLATGTYPASVNSAGTQITFTYAPAAGQAFAVGDKVTITTNSANYSVSSASITAVTATSFTVAANVPVNAPLPTNLPQTATSVRTTFGGIYNMTLGTRNYLIQQNWANRSPSGVCALS